VHAAQEEQKKQAIATLAALAATGIMQQGKEKGKEKEKGPPLEERAPRPPAVPVALGPSSADVRGYAEVPFLCLDECSYIMY
jgi:hypothetical protein